MTNDKGKVYAEEVVRVEYQAPERKTFGRQAPQLGIGVHLNLTQSAPVSPAERVTALRTPVVVDLAREAGIILDEAIPVSLGPCAEPPRPAVPS